MSASKLEKLLFSIGVVDKATGAVARIQKSLGNLSETAKSAGTDIGVGVAGLMGIGYSVEKMLMPAIEMDRVLGEVKSLGINDAALKKLSHTALEFSSAYGKSATEFVSASYTIQSAIAGLTGSELAAFTKASAVLAAATKADTETITAYMGTMYGIFGKTAEQMGKSDWVEMTSGMTAQAVEMFNLTGKKITSAFASLGAAGASLGISQAEQMAVLGESAAVWDGSVAGTKYKAFLAGIAQAQEKLDMSFTDSTGKILPIVDILEKIQGKYGDLNAMETLELQKAFGSKQAVDMLTFLLDKTDKLSGNIKTLGKINGMSKAEEMAADMVDQFERLEASTKAIRIAFGSALLPALVPFIEMLADGARGITNWTQEFQTVTKCIGYAVLAVMSLSASVLLVNTVVALSRIAMAGWAITVTAVTTVLKVLRFALLATALASGPILLIGAGITMISAAVWGLITVLKKLWNMFADSKFGKWLGSLIGSTENLALDVNPTPQDTPISQNLKAPQQLSVPVGGLRQQISKTFATQNQQTHVTNNITTSQPITGGLIEELLMAGG